VKSFRFYLTHRPDPPQKTVEDYSPAELDGFLETFRDKRQRCMRHRRLLLIVIVVGAVVLCGGSLLSLHREVFFEWSIAWVVFGLIWGAACAILGVLRCPACRNELDSADAEYCPVCGVILACENGSGSRPA
jgi:hypothetical protein